MTFLVRQARLDDADGIAGVHVRAWQVGYRDLLPDEVLDGLSVDQRETEWARWLGGDDDGTGITLVAVDGDRVLGFCSVATPSGESNPNAESAEITALYVEPTSWRRGIGTALLSHAFAVLRRERRYTVTLWVIESNLRACAFYEGFGFVPDGAIKYDEDGPVQFEHGPRQIQLRFDSRR